MRFLLLLLLLPGTLYAACVESPTGVWTCGQLVSSDANPALENATQFYPNVSVSAPPTCTTTTNFTLHDVDNTSAKLWGFCGTTSLFSGSDDAIRLIVREASGQTADALQIQNSASTVLANVDAAGILKAKGQALTISTSTGKTAGAESAIVCNTTSADVTIALPACAGVTGREYHIKNNGGGHNCIVDPNASETIDGATTLTIDGKSAATIVCDGSVWWIL